MSDPWTAHEDRILKREFHKGTSDRQIATFLDRRTIKSCVHRRQRLGMWRTDEQPLLTFRDEWQERLCALLDERDARARVPLTLDNILNGTPPRGRSAYDGWQPQGAELANQTKERPQPYHPLFSPKRFGDHSVADDSRETK